MKKGIVCVSAILILISLLAFSMLWLVRSAVGNVDYDLDDRLFNGSGLGTTTTYLAYIDGELCEIYQSFGDGRQTAVRLDSVSEYLKSGFISVEDRRFYKHHGVDIKRTVGAAINCLLHFRSDFGGSTITQQVVKNMSGDNERSVGRKIAEIFRAIHIENEHSKDEILELYLNIVPMSRKIYGVEEASRCFFGKSCGDLTLAEAATIVGITNAPGRYDPISHPEDCLAKRNRVLFAMRDCKAIDEEEYSAALSQPLGVIYQDDGDEISSWFVETARSEIINDLCYKYSISESAARIVLSRGTRVILTVDPMVQEILESRLENTDMLPMECSSGLNYAMVVNDVSTGNTVGLVGASGKKSGERLLNMATAKRPPASTLKPLALYAPMIDEGIINMASVFDDTPVQFNRNENEYVAYPKNSPDVYDGLTTVTDAVKASKNTVAVRLFEMRGAKKIADDLSSHFGISGLCSSDYACAPLAMGQLTYGVSLRSLTNAYTVFPADGIFRGGKCYLGVFDSDGRVLLENEGIEKRVFKAETARIINQLLLGVTESGTARSVKLKELVDTAGKTGTSSGDKDRYFIGYTPYYCAGIRVGYSDGSTPIGSLIPSHLSVWNDIMTEIHEKKVLSNREPRPFSTEGLNLLEYCRDSGDLISDSCLLDPRADRIAKGYFTSDNSPCEECHTHVTVLYDSLYGAVSCGGCEGEDLCEIALIDVRRSFPCEVYIKDAEYVYRGEPLGFDAQGYDQPYFYSELNDGEYVGRSKSKKQFNSGCYIHSGK